ncbi:hypothetical protein ACFQ22_10795 [Lentilactobacillus raoultii]|uniref:DUF3899 domain-containing protein n=1 Tax=Lentilactobacillus raoultii TaxID=1987503 RepID=A0ABW3PQN8_9LACO|nr:hypothetical protein [Lentilactobacillus raoultii]
MIIAIILVIGLFFATIILMQTGIISLTIGVGLQLLSFTILFWYLYGLMIYNLHKYGSSLKQSDKFWLAGPSGKRINPYNKKGLMVITIVTIFSTVIFLAIFLSIIYM